MINRILKQRQITVEDRDDLALRNLYEEAFPEDEQIPWGSLVGLISEMNLDFTAYYADNQLLGFTIVYPSSHYNWFWYFAVQPDLRGKGIGQQILTALINKYKGQRNILDMESPVHPCDNLEQRKRRHEFYLRNGFRDTNVFKTFDTVTMTIMMMGEGGFTDKDYDEILGDLKRFWWLDSGE